MIHPIELRENTFLIDNHYPLNLFLNRCNVGEIGRTALYLHWHDHFEFIYMAAGNVIFHIDGQQYDASPGDILIVPSGVLHVGYAASNEEIQYWALVFNRSLLEGAASDPIHGRYLTPYLQGKIRFPAKINDSSLLDPIRDIFNDIISEFEER
ncbi:AraC family ligand binding domain-containing protein, partial [Mycobacterium tuberculosis]